MKVAGQALLHAPINRVWEALNDPAVLVRAIPGCERLEATGPDAYAMTVTAGVAAIKGTYAGEVALRDFHEPTSFVLEASGAGGPGTVSASVKVSLSEVSDGTRLDYDADAVVGGVIGGVGQRMLVGVAKKMAGEFFAGVDAVLNESGSATPAPTLASSATDAAAQADVPVGSNHPATETAARVFTAPKSQAGSNRATSHRGEASFAVGAVVGALAALAGVLVGVRLSRAR